MLGLLSDLEVRLSQLTQRVGSVERAVARHAIGTEPEPEPEVVVADIDDMPGGAFDRWVRDTHGQPYHRLTPKARARARSEYASADASSVMRGRALGAGRVVWPLALRAECRRLALIDSGTRTLPTGAPTGRANELLNEAAQRVGVVLPVPNTEPGSFSYLPSPGAVLSWIHPDRGGQQLRTVVGYAALHAIRFWDRGEILDWDLIWSGRHRQLAALKRGPQG